MELTIGFISGLAIKIFALLTPPAVLSAFIGHTAACDHAEKKLIALKTSSAIFTIGAVLYIWGAHIFEMFGFTLDAFRIGSGVLLMLTAIDLMRSDGKSEDSPTDGDCSIVPLAIPMGMGPASIGALMVMGAQAQTWKEIAAGLFALFMASLGMYILLRMSDITERALHHAGIVTLAKLTGLLLAAIAAQVIFTGIGNFFHLIEA